MRHIAPSVGLVLVVATVVVAVQRARTVSGAEAVAAAPQIRVTSKLPVWVAPGVRVTVAGFAGPHALVRLHTGGGSPRTARAGRRGAFRASFMAPGPGRYPVAVSSSGARVRVGVLEVRPVILDAVGDVTTGEQVGATASTVGSAYPWTAVGATLRSADLATANLEGAVSLRGAPVPDKEFHFRGPATLLAGAHSTGGLDVVTVANNHSGDFGPTALLDTIRLARASGIHTVGGGRNEVAARRAVVLVVGGLRIAFVGLSDVNPLGFNATATAPGTARADPATVAEAVAAARARADVVVCWFHWGEELHADPSARQQQLATAALRAGAQVVLGAHPHVFGRVSSPARGTVVAWTLGNFVFPSSSPATTRTGILTVALDRHGVRGWRVIGATINGFRPALDRQTG